MLVLSVSLQLRAKDIADAFTETSNVIKTLEQIRNDVDTTHLAWHEEALQLGGKVGVIPSVPRRCGRQCNRDNMPAEDSKTYFRHTLTIPFLDQLIVEMKARFSYTQRKAVLGLSLVPTAMEKDWKANALIVMIFLMLITFLWSFIAGNLNGMDTVEISQVIQNKHCHMQIVLSSKY